MAAQRIRTLMKAARQLGLRQMADYALYALQLRSGWLRLRTPAGGRAQPPSALQRIIEPAAPAVLRRLLGTRQREVLAAADEVLRGQVRLFGGPPRRLALARRTPQQHWTQYTRSLPDGEDIKPVWELGRLGWATLLARAYWLSGDERYARAWWQRVQRFLAANPVNCGPHWSSAQEVALRLLALSFSFNLLAEAQASTVARQAWLSQALAAHAARIPISLRYARAQNNNHLLSEALGLWTAGLMLPDHPQAAQWQRLGRQHFIDGVRRQVAPDGAYSQHSANYQRLMLQLATWATALARAEAQPLPRATLAQLGQACRWLFGLLDERSGQAANLGPNDGAYILPFSVAPFADYRPALQAAAWALGVTGLPAGPWDELPLWLGLAAPRGTQRTSAAARKTRAPLRLERGESWAYLRAAHFNGRPGHADQLHLDLWWRGLNIALDAGTYRYTAAAPWDNALASTAVHNTLMLAGREQMQRAGRFLWLDFAQARVLQHSRQRASAEHDGYRAIGCTHRRSVQALPQAWRITDEVLGDTQGQRGRLHWLLPDWPWQLHGDTLQLRSPRGRIEIQIEGQALSLLRAGQRLHGSAASSPTAGWVSATYGSKQPALALIAEPYDGALHKITTYFRLPA
ncbi:MAG: heparinase II/III family protein [Anaerolineales bacterium]|nr:heparinase II/III family protein [Anaerolineales bacterium]